MKGSMTKKKKVIVIGLATVMIVTNLLVTEHMERAFPKVMAQNLSIGGDHPNQLPVYSPSSNSWSLRAFQSAMGSFFGGLAGAVSGGNVFRVLGY